MPRLPLPQRSLTYPEVGATARRPLPPGYEHLEAQAVLGRGERVFRDASERLSTWQLHRGAGLRVRASTPRAEQGSVVLLQWGRLFRAPCRVVEVELGLRLVGFAYGTLQGHPERGEERFAIEWRDDDAVLLTIAAFSRPATWWARLGAPVSRLVQRHLTGRYLRAL
ncbi:DUF1990 family protein [Naasia aerilata]|uniref:DUF1990 domain-containing protein n=1 Tax=Naasia aerilata TaxID=1162966 RepID=A0ABM8GG12_9MICO|nr:DUF1990 domain-containing protein [Naasia aerilata]BDZ47296.1 DUF1990 domain-containing protein [Naasia aerilata]